MKKTLLALMFIGFFGAPLFSAEKPKPTEEETRTEEVLTELPEELPVK
ncbi:hypothetical protein KAU11_00830 [Candidatus Babeliales bacterium]|nr:hypothetical protein [Candidatus Babeliales bacterium]